MRKCFYVLALGLAATIPACAPPDNSPPPDAVPVPAPQAWDNGRMRQMEPTKPLPPQADLSVPAPFYDPPLVVDQPPESRAYADTWKAVGRPRIAIFVNRTLEGQVVPTHDPRPAVSVERTRRDITPDKPPTERRDNIDVYLHRGQYDEVAAKAIDYEMMENLLTDWLSADNQVQVISPTMARKRLTDEQVKELQAGRPKALAEIAQQLDADILVQVQARPTRQTEQGLGVRVIAESFNIRGGASLARAAVDVPPPLDKPQLNRYTRFVSRKLMDGMIGSWRAAGEARGAVPGPGPGPATQP